MWAWIWGTVRHLERMQLGTPYTQVVQRVWEVLRHPMLEGQCRLVVDATGLGAPVVDLLRSAKAGGRLTAVSITSGDRAHGQGERWHVPRGDLLSGLEVMLEAGTLKIVRQLKEAERLVREMESMRLEGQGGEHDDLVFAVALAVWRARWTENSFGTQRLPGI